MLRCQARAHSSLAVLLSLRAARAAGMAAAVRRRRASPPAGRLLRLALLLAAATPSCAVAYWASTLYAGSATAAANTHVDGALTSGATFSFASSANNLAFAPNGTLYLSDNTALRVVDPGSATVRTLVNGTNFYGLCVNGATGELYALDYGASPKQLVQVYGNGSKRIIATTGISLYAVACAVDNSGFIIVANTYSCARARVAASTRAPQQARC
jgi:hypothetical protein